MMCWYVGNILGVRYRENQRKKKLVLYTDPSDLFLVGVMDIRQGTCGSMPLLYITLGWRLGWPLSLACVGSHCICRYDDGKKIINIEATNTDRSGASSHPLMNGTCKSTTSANRRGLRIGIASGDAVAKCWAYSLVSARDPREHLANGRSRVGLLAGSLLVPAKPAIVHQSEPSQRPMQHGLIRAA